VPDFGAGVYTIWHHDGRFIYVGMSGRGMTADTVRQVAAAAISSAFTWLIDLPLPTLSQEDITAIASDRHQMDVLVRKYIHENLSYPFVILADGKAARALETEIRAGKWELGRPLLNPGK
jgi:hypothetical protein